MLFAEFLSANSEGPLCQRAMVGEKPGNPLKMVLL